MIDSFKIETPSGGGGFDQEIYINFGNGVHSSPTGGAQEWNTLANVGFTPTTFSNLDDKTGTPTAVDLYVPTASQSWNGVNNQHDTGITDADSLIHGDITKSLFVNAANHASYGASNCIMELQGLEAGGIYDLYILCSHGSSRVAGIQVTDENGSSSVDDFEMEDNTTYLEWTDLEAIDTDNKIIITYADLGEDLINVNAMYLLRHA